MGYAILSELFAVYQHCLKYTGLPIHYFAIPAISSSIVRTHGFVYDDERRLSTVLDQSAGNNSYTYDDRGNILSR